MESFSSSELYEEPYEEEIVEDEYPDCSSNYDLITLDKWSENPPDVKINFYTDEGKTITNCYQSESLRQWLNDQGNTFALWKNKPGQIIDQMGYGGEPDPKNLVVKLYTGEFVILDDLVESLKVGLKNIKLDAYPIGIKRIGNLSGFGISQHHGQAPGYRIYKLMLPGTITENMFQYLPNSLVYQILRKLPTRDIYNFVNSSKSMKNRLMPIYQLLLKEREQKEHLEEQRKIDKIRNMTHSGTLLYAFIDKGKLGNIILGRGAVLDLAGPGKVYLPEIRVVGYPEVIRLFLSQEGLSAESIDKLMKTAISPNLTTASGQPILTTARGSRYYINPSGMKVYIRQ